MSSPQREELAERLKKAWFDQPTGRPINDGWLNVADVAMAAEQAAERPIAEWERELLAAEPAVTLGRAWEQPAEGPRDHRYEINIVYPGDGGECYEKGSATATELAHRLRFEANLCAAAVADYTVLPAPDEIVDGAPSWKASGVGFLPTRFTAWSNGVQLDADTIVGDLAGLEATALAILAATNQVRMWRQP
ncbi:MAG TPA: hypothetical protein VK735_32560 [Pseudonocardia sp.]|uniref:hypothetical protein n=1 Tax=Pseudonocardia sp. TaxID=60912 RepID=UPI002BFFA2BC|nr:hypothetical protein [Pseudonocardia sp.]HTF52201.1 hypothetical protein [Pseudonocardia sp.]